MGQLFRISIHRPNKLSPSNWKILPNVSSLTHPSVPFMAEKRNYFLLTGFHAFEQLQGDQTQRSFTAEAEGAKAIFQHRSSPKRLEYLTHLVRSFLTKASLLTLASDQNKWEILNALSWFSNLERPTAANKGLPLLFDDSLAIQSIRT